MLLPSESSLTGALPFPALVQALRDAFAAGADVPLRHTHHIGTGGEGVAQGLDQCGERQRAGQR